jgi:predicted transcriptional regulator
MNLNSTVAELMSTNIECVQPDQQIIDLKHIYEKQPFHQHIPVTENNQLVGIVSLIDFMRAIHNASLDDNEPVYHSILVKDIMSIHPVSIAATTTLKEASKQLIDGGFHSLIVTENNEVKGMITTTDILNYLVQE